MSSRSSRRTEAKAPPPKSRQSASGGRSSLSRQISRENFSGGEIVTGKRNRNRPSYVVDFGEDDEDEDEEEEEDEDAEGEEDDTTNVQGEIIVSGDMDVDADGDEDEELDAEGEEDDMDVDSAPPAPSIKVSKPPARGSASSKPKRTSKATAKVIAQQARDSDEDDEELSELESEAEEIQDTVKAGGGDDDEDEDEDAEGEDEEMEEIEPSGQNDDDEELDSDDDGEAPDLTKMTKRQRARFEEGAEDSLLKLSDEVQAKKVFTAEELSMRRAEMARRRRNLSDKRNEEVKMETINKLLKKQAPKTNKKSQLADGETEDEGPRPDPTIVRWINNKQGSRVGVPREMAEGPAGKVFTVGGLKSGKMVEEVS